MQERKKKIPVTAVLYTTTVTVIYCVSTIKMIITSVPSTHFCFLSHQSPIFTCLAICLSIIILLRFFCVRSFLPLMVSTDINSWKSIEGAENATAHNSFKSLVTKYIVATDVSIKAAFTEQLLCSLCLLHYCWGNHQPGYSMEKKANPSSSFPDFCSNEAIIPVLLVSVILMDQWFKLSYHVI